MTFDIIGSLAHGWVLPRTGRAGAAFERGTRARRAVQNCVF
jgi:hypothetical protein